MPHAFDPEGMFILAWAIILDLMGIITGILILVFGIGLLLSYVVDIIGILTIGVWSFFKTGELPITKRLMRFLKRPGLAAFGELLPIVGILPIWTLYVFTELRKG